MLGLDWWGYRPFLPTLSGPLDEMPRPEARAAFNRLMDQKAERIDQLQRLIASNGVRLRDAPGDLRDFENLLFSSVELDSIDSGELSGLWLGVALDTGLFLGDALIKRKSQLKWKMFDGSKKAIEYQRPVVSGFTNVVNKSYCVDFPRGIALALTGHASGRWPHEPDLLVEWLDQTTERA